MFQKNKLISTRILKEEDYHIIVKDMYMHFKINDNMVCFFNGKEWNLILLKDMLVYPVLYFDFWHKKDNTIYKNSLVVCPITMRSMIYKGRIQITDIINDQLYLKNIDTNDVFLMDTPYTGKYDSLGKEKKIKSHVVKRHEAKILTLLNSFTILIDPKYIVLNKDKKKDTIINYDYYTNKYSYDNQPIYTSYHPKTIVYMIQYYSESKKKYIYTAIIGKDINKNVVSGYNYKKSGLWRFLSKNLELYIKKKFFIYPVFWFMVDKLYNDVKMVLIK